MLLFLLKFYRGNLGFCKFCRCCDFAELKIRQRSFCRKLKVEYFCFLLTAFYKPEPGLLLDTWIDSSSKLLENFESISGYPGCPTGMRNLANFEWGVTSAPKYHHFRFRAYFVPQLSGTHRLIVACKKECQVDFVLQPGVIETVNHTDTTSTTIGWSKR